MLRRLHAERPGLLGGLTALLAGLWVMAGWLAASPAMIRALPGPPTVFDAGVGFVLAGLLLAWRPARLPHADAVQTVLAVLLLAAATLVQVEHVFGIDAGIDLGTLHARAGVDEFRSMLDPGRLPWGTALALSFVALAYLLRRRLPRQLLLIDVASIAPGLIALLGLIDLALGQDDAYAWIYTRHASMSPLSALVLIALSFGLWTVAHRDTQRRTARETEDRRIVHAAALVMIPLAVLVGFGGFVAARNLAEYTMRQALVHALNERVRYVDEMLTQRLQRLSYIAAQVAIGRALRDDSPPARTALADEIISLRASGFSAVRFEGPHGVARAASGYFAAPAPWSFELSAAQGARLQWDGGYRVSARTPIVVGLDVVGYAVTEQPLPYLSMLFRPQMPGQGNAESDTTEVLIAWQDGAFIRTFPSRFSNHAHAAPMTRENLAVVHSVSGRSGVLKTRDYRDRDVMAAFAPVGDTGLGMVVKVDLDEFYAPIARQFRLWTLLLWVLVVGGLGLLHRFVRPLARRLVRSEAAAHHVSDLLQRKAETLEDSEAQVRAILDSTSDAVLTLNHDGAVASCNAAARRVFGRSPEALTGKRLVELIDTDADVCATTPGVIINGRIPRADGESVAVEMTLGRVAGAGAVGWVAVVRDVSERERVQAALREVHGRLEDGLARLLRRNREMALLGRMSRALQGSRTEADIHRIVARFGARLFPGQACTLYASGADRVDAVSRSNGGARLPAGPDVCPLHGMLGRTVACGLRHNMVCEHAGAVQDRQTLLCVPLTVQDEPLGALTVQLGEAADAETRAAYRHLATAAGEHIALALANIRLRDTLRGQSIRDPLTGLYNRRYLEEAYRQAEAGAIRSGAPLTFVLLDIDHFKHFNDTYGHEIGDMLLRELGALLRTSVREGDTACRFGGEEFALLLPGASLEDGVARAEEVRAAIAARLQLLLDGRRLEPVTASFGVAAWPQAGRDLRALVRAADRALYKAKASGRNRVVAAPPLPPDGAGAIAEA